MANRMYIDEMIERARKHIARGEDLEAKAYIILIRDKLPQLREGYRNYIMKNYKVFIDEYINNKKD